VRKLGLPPASLSTRRKRDDIFFGNYRRGIDTPTGPNRSVETIKNRFKKNKKTVDKIFVWS